MGLVGSPQGWHLAILCPHSEQGLRCVTGVIWDEDEDWSWLGMGRLQGAWGWPCVTTAAQAATPLSSACSSCATRHTSPLSLLLKPWLT